MEKETCVDGKRDYAYKKRGLCTSKQRNLGTWKKRPIYIWKKSHVYMKMKKETYKYPKRPTNLSRDPDQRAEMCLYRRFIKRDL